MISIDKKVAKAARKLADTYKTLLVYEPGTNKISVAYSFNDYGQSVFVSVPVEDIPRAIFRLSDSGYIHIKHNVDGGTLYFSIEPKLKHRFAFWFDSFSKRYIAGFISGVAVTLTADLLITPIRSLFSALFQLLPLP